MKTRLRALPLLGVAFIAGLAATDQLGNVSAEDGQKLAGSARVIDGDTLTIGDDRIRLAGLDAPESDQTCKDGDGRTWACGQTATDWLKARTNGRKVACRSEGKDRYGRVIGRCEVAGESLNQGLLASGLAVAYMGNWRDELTAIKARFTQKGIWQGEFIEPADYRAHE